MTAVARERASDISRLGPCIGPQGTFAALSTAGATAGNYDLLTQGDLQGTR